MTDEKLLLYLNWFYTLELTQLSFYLTQSKRCEDKYIAQMLLHLVEREILHAKRIKKHIKLLNGSPTKISSLLSKIGGYISEFTIFFEPVDIFLLNYNLESLAIKDYNRFLGKIDVNNQMRKELVEDLFQIMLDEDLHKNWFIAEREDLKKIKE